MTAEQDGLLNLLLRSKSAFWALIRHYPRSSLHPPPSFHGITRVIPKAIMYIFFRNSVEYFQTSRFCLVDSFANHIYSFERQVKVSMQTESYIVNSGLMWKLESCAGRWHDRIALLYHFFTTLSGIQISLCEISQ